MASKYFAVPTFLRNFAGVRPRDARNHLGDCLMTNEELKSCLVERLKKANAFWSYDMSSVKDVPDDILVELVMRYLDVDEISMLFRLYTKKAIKQAWIENLVPDERCYQMNRFFAWYYFGIKTPGRYVKAMATRQMNKRMAA